jgi:hypothetical protein
LQTQDDLLQTLAATVSDYRQGEIPPISPEHIRLWLEQFDAADRPIILAELASILERTYLSRASIKDSLRRFLHSVVISGRTPASVLPCTTFLDIQTGESQRSLLGIVAEILREEHGWSLDACGTEEPETFIYLDDAVYTGNRLRHDLASESQQTPGWITTTAPRGATLIIFAVLAHLTGWDYALRRIEAEARVKVLDLLALYDSCIEHERITGGKAQCLWPEELTGDPAVDQYVWQVRDRLAEKGLPDCLFRDPDTPPVETVFSSKESRQVVESAFLRAGCRLFSASVRQPHLRPLGFEVLESLGFGTLVVSYQNISNTCPLVLWWDQPGVWRPLFPRRAR